MNAEENGVDLTREILEMDAKLFNAFNQQDIETIKEVMREDLEFYHDTGGLGDYAQTIEGFSTLFARDDGLNRRLLPGSTEIFPIKDYGAIQVGAHEFCHQENGKDDCGTFKFLHIWSRDDGVWKLSRVVSYDH